MSSNLKVALCISSLRAWKASFPALKRNILDVLHPDVFICTFDKEKGWKERAQSNVYNDFYVRDPDAKDKEYVYIDEKEVAVAFNPTKMLIIPFDEAMKDQIEHIRRPDALLNNPDKKRWSQYNLPMFYAMYLANTLKINHELEEGFGYDLVIKARTDIKFPMIPKFVLDQLDKLWYYPKDHNESHVVSDKFAMSNTHIMDYYCDAFIKLNDYWAEGMTNSRGYWKIGEEMMWYHIVEKSSIEVRSWGYDYYDTQRATETRMKDYRQTDPTWWLDDFGYITVSGGKLI